MFLTRGDMPHEASWAAWLRSAEGMVPIDPAQNALCAHKPDPGKCPWANGVRQVTRGCGHRPLHAVSQTPGLQSLCELPPMLAALAREGLANCQRVACTFSHAPAGRGLQGRANDEAKSINL